MSNAPYRIVEHMADVGLEAWGRTLSEAFVHAAQGMFAILTPEVPVKLERTFEFELSADKPEELLVVWLNKLLYLYDAEKVILGRFDITLLEPTKLAATVAGETLDPKRHPVKTYIKAATYHQTIVQANAPCKVRVYFDV